MVEAFILTPEFAFALDFVVKLLLAFVIGFIIGLERESRGKDAGISTHALVIMGAMLFTYISSFDPVEPSRIAAQVVMGVGFLGGGLILKDGMSVRNLTTAASLWFAAAIGMAIGYEYYAVAIISAIGAIIVLRIPHVTEQRHTT
jgi:putative Mg2+ transporter-C (MgtC) family protein